MLNISLPDSIQTFVQEQAIQGGYNSIDEYILHLLAVEQARVARVESLLLEGLDSGESIEATDEWWEEKRAQLLQGRTVQPS